MQQHQRAISHWFSLVFCWLGNGVCLAVFSSCFMFSGVVEVALLQSSMLEACEHPKTFSARSPHLNLSNTVQIQQKPPWPAVCVCSCCLCALHWIMNLMNPGLASICVWLWSWMKQDERDHQGYSSLISLGTVADIAFGFYFTEEEGKLWV